MSPAQVKCPTCGRASEWSAAQPWRPFCSERCRLLDLGAWLAGERAIPGDKVDDRADAERDDGDGAGEPRERGRPGAKA